MANQVNMDIIKPVQSRETRYTNWYNINEPTVQFRSSHLLHQTMESVDSGEHSGPQWENSSPSPHRSPSHPLLGRFPSSDSRARAIARGQWELMEMVKNMPESSYELSLKDLVENQESLEKNDEGLHQRAVVKSKRSKEEGKKIVISGFENKGLFLNMVFPFSLKSGKRKKNKVGRNYNNSKISPKVDGTGEKEWWKKRFTGSSDSNSSGISNSSGGTTTTTTVSSRGGSSSSGGNGGGGRKINGLPTGCWSFFCSRGRKSVG